MCTVAVKNNGKAIIYVPKLQLTTELCKMAMAHDDVMLDSIDEYYHTLDFCLLALKKI